MEQYVSTLLDLVIIFAIGGVSWQLMRVLSKTTEALNEFKITNAKVNKLVDKVSYDYEYISSLIRGISATIDRVNSEIMNPIRRIGGLFRSGEGLIRGFLRNFGIGDTSSDYLPDEK